MNDREVIQKLEEIRNAVDRLTLLLYAHVAPETSNRKNAHKLFDAYEEVVKEHYQRERPRSSPYFNPDNPYKPKDYDKD